MGGYGKLQVGYQVHAEHVKGEGGHGHDGNDYHGQPQNLCALKFRGNDEYPSIKARSFHGASIATGLQGVKAMRTGVLRHAVRAYCVISAPALCDNLPATLTRQESLANILS